MMILEHYVSQRPILHARVCSDGCRVAARVGVGVGLAMLRRPGAFPVELQ